MSINGIVDLNEEMFSYESKDLRDRITYDGSLKYIEVFRASDLEPIIFMTQDDKGTTMVEYVTVASTGERIASLVIMPDHISNMDHYKISDYLRMKERVMTRIQSGFTRFGDEYRDNETSPTQLFRFSPDTHNDLINVSEISPKGARSTMDYADFTTFAGVRLPGTVTRQKDNPGGLIQSKTSRINISYKEINEADIQRVREKFHAHEAKARPAENHEIQREIHMSRPSKR